MLLAATLALVGAAAGLLSFAAAQAGAALTHEEYLSALEAADAARTAGWIGAVMSTPTLGGCWWSKLSVPVYFMGGQYTEVYAYGQALDRVLERIMPVEEALFSLCRLSVGDAFGELFFRR